MDIFEGKAAIQQRVLPSYRVPFFDALADACSGGLALAAGAPRPDEMIEPGKKPTRAHFFSLNNRHFFNEKAYLCYQAGLIAWLEAVQPDVLVMEANPRYLSTPQAVGWMHRRRLPVIGWGLGAPSPSGRLGFIWRSFLHQFDGMIAYSQVGMESYSRYGFPPERVFVAPNAVTARPKMLPVERPLSKNHPATVLFVGRLQERKRIDLLLKACAALPENRRPRLIIVGDGPARADFEAQARQNFPSAEFVGARYDRELSPFFSQADLFVLPGTGGLAVQQAMSFSLPVIVARGDGTQSDLVRPANGWQIPADDLPALESTLNEALSDLPRLRMMGRESFRIVSEEINLENMVGVFVQALTNVTVKK